MGKKENLIEGGVELVACEESVKDSQRCHNIMRVWNVGRFGGVDRGVRRKSGIKWVESIGRMGGCRDARG